MLLLLVALELFPTVPKGPYFPDKVGVAWTYENGGQEMTLVVTKVDNGVVSVGRPHPQLAEPAPVYTVRLTPGGLERSRWDDKQLVCFKTKGTWRTLNETRTAVGVEKIGVAAGEFECVRVDVVAGEDAWSEWYAPGVGRVKYVGTAGRVKGSVEVLKHFWPTGLPTSPP